MPGQKRENHLLKNNLFLIFILMCFSCSMSSNLNQSEKFNEMVEEHVENFSSPLITVKELASKLEHNKNEVILLDAREEKEFNVSHLNLAVHIGYENFDIDKVIKTLSEDAKDKDVIVYCSVGYRSGDLADRLREKGIRSFNLFGGIFEWVNQGFDVYDLDNLQTQKVHTYNKTWSKWLFRGTKVN